MSKTYILHNNNAKKLLKNCKKKYNFPINNQVTYPFLFKMNLLIFQFPNVFSQFFFKYLKIF